MGAFDEYLEFALRTAEAASAVIMPLYNHTTTEWKSDDSPVTEADRGAERVIRDMITATYPGHGIIGEEFGTTDEGRDLCWVIDPIDGTAGFTLGFPLFGTLIALLQGDEPVVGVINLPAMSEAVYAARGSGCWYRAGSAAPVRVSVREPVGLAEAYVSTTGSHSSDIESDDSPTGLINVVRTARRFRFGGDCAQHTLICRGRLDAVIDTEMKPWDTAALVPCVEEAGGVCATVTGARERVVFGGSFVSATNVGLLEQLVDAMKR